MGRWVGGWVAYVLPTATNSPNRVERALPAKSTIGQPIKTEWVGGWVGGYVLPTATNSPNRVESAMPTKSTIGQPIKTAWPAAL